MNDISKNLQNIYSKPIHLLRIPNVLREVSKAIRKCAFGFKEHCYCGPLLQSTTDISLSAKFSFSLSFSLSFSSVLDLIIYKTLQCNCTYSTNPKLQ